MENKTPLILSLISLVAVAAMGIIFLTSPDGKKKAPATPEGTTETTAQKGDIVYFNLDRILNEYDMANDLRAVVQSKVQSIQEEVNRRGTRLQNDINKLNDDINKGLVLRSVAEQKGQSLAQRQQEFQNYAAQKDQEIMEEQQVMVNQIGDAIKTFLDKYNDEKQYAMIISTQGEILPAPIASGDPHLDITDEILAGLNEEYVKTKNAKPAQE